MIKVNRRKRSMLYLTFRKNLEENDESLILKNLVTSSILMLIVDLKLFKTDIRILKEF